MRIFNGMHLLLTILYSQTDLVKIPSINPDTVLHELNQRLEQEGQLSSLYRLKSYDNFEKQSVYEIIRSEKKLDTLLINKDCEIKDEIVNQIFKPYRAIEIDNGFEDINNMLRSRYYFINEIPIYRLGIIEKKLGASIAFYPAFESNASGIMGISKAQNNWNINGELILHIENYFLNAENIHLYWKGIDSLSQLVKIGFDIPHPFGISTGIDWDYHHEVYKGLFSSIENRLLLKTFIPIFGSIGMGYTVGRVKPTEEGIYSGYNYVSYEAFSLNSKKNNTNSRILPSSGTILEIELDGGLDRKTHFIQSSILYKQIFRIYSQTYVNYIFNGKFINYFKDTIPKSRYFRYGGASSIRGYDEQEFQSPQYHISSFELCFKPNNKMQGMLFFDVGSDKLNDYNEYLYGYGIGLRQISKEFVINIEYGLSGDNLRNGKLHIKWISRF